MNNDLTIEDVLSPFEKGDIESFTEHEVSIALRKLTPKDSNQVAMEIRAEAMAFDFCENYNHEKTGWGTYFGPMYVSSNGDGTAMEAPSIQLVTPEMIEYWEKRANASTNPMLKARYAGLVYDFSKKIINTAPSHSLATIYIRSLIAIAEKKLHKYEYDIIQKLKRALSIAIAFNYGDLIKQVEQTILNYEESVSCDEKKGSLGISFDLLMENSGIELLEETESRIIKDLEKKLDRLTSSETSKVDPWAAETVAIRLAKYYRKRGKNLDVKRVILLAGNVYDQSIGDSAAMQVSARLEHLLKIYKEFGLKEEAENTMIKLRAIGPKVNAEMGTVPFSFELPKDKIDQFLNEILDGDLNTVLTRIAVHYIPNKAQAKKQLFALSKQAPLQYIIGHKLQDEKGRVVASIGSLESDLDGHIVRQITQSMAFSGVFMRMTFAELINRFGFKMENIIGFISESPVIDQERIEIIKRGVSAYFQNDHLMALHLLVPQIEDSVRNVVEYAGGNVLKPTKSGTGFHLKTMDEILRDNILTKAFGEDMTLYFKILFTDQRGWNLRNNICHGSLRESGFNQQTSDRVIHTLLCLGLLRKKE